MVYKRVVSWNSGYPTPFPGWKPTLRDTKSNLILMALRQLSIYIYTLLFFLKVRFKPPQSFSRHYKELKFSQEHSGEWSQKPLIYQYVDLIYQIVELCMFLTFSRLFQNHKMHLLAPLFGPFCRPKWQIPLPFHILELVKSLPVS